MQHSPRKARLKLLGSLVILTLVFVIAAIAQFYGFDGLLPETQSQKPQTNVQRPRAVFGGDPLPAPSKESSAPSESPTAEAEQASRSREEATLHGDVNSLLTRWRITLVRGDVDAQASLYAPQLNQFFRRRNVSRETVRRERARMMELYPTVLRYDISDVRIEPKEEDRALVSFRKDWDMRGDRRFAGAERQTLMLQRIGGEWKIVSEEETKIYWVQRS